TPRRVRGGRCGKPWTSRIIAVPGPANDAPMSRVGGWGARWRLSCVVAERVRLAGDGVRLGLWVGLQESPDAVDEVALEEADGFLVGLAAGALLGDVGGGGGGVAE